MKNLIIVFPLVLASLLGGVSNATQQSAGPTEKEPQAVTFEMLREIVREIEKRVKSAGERGNTLTEIDALRALEAEYAAKGTAAKMAVATWMMNLAPVIGNYGEALYYADVIYSNQPTGQPVSESALDGYKPVSALVGLARAAARTRVIMINEAHHVPQHRAFTIALLKKLRRKGFTYFAAETLYEADTRLGERGYPTKQTGYYTAEPVYGDLVRTALKLGYRVVAYEPPFKDADQRERDQARNIFERTLKRDPDARVLVHAGYSHIDEAGMKTGAITMAQRFKELTGIDPLTVDQTEMSERFTLEHENSLYRHVTSKRTLIRPTVFQTAKGRLWSMDKHTHDVTLFHPRSHYAYGRPTWLRLGGSRMAYLPPVDICGRSGRCLMRARAANESADAIPIDQVEVKQGQRPPALMLPWGMFVIESQDGEGKRIKSFQIKMRRS